MPGCWLQDRPFILFCRITSFAVLCYALDFTLEMYEADLHNLESRRGQQLLAGAGCRIWGCRGAGIAQPREQSERRGSQTLSRCAQRKGKGQAATKKFCLDIRNKPFRSRVVSTSTGYPGRLCFSFLGDTQTPAGQSLSNQL